MALRVGPSVASRRAVRVLAVGLLPVLALVAAVSMNRTEPVTRLGLASGGAWLLSPGQSLITLVDGPAQQVAASIRLSAAPTDLLTVSQDGSDAYVVNQTQGTVSRVDGANLRLEQPVRFADSPDSLQLALGPHSLYVVDTTRRQASLVDPVTLHVRSQVALSARTGPDQAVVDDHDRLWLIDADRGGLSWLQDGSKHDAPAAAAATDRLVWVNGTPAVADIENGRVGTLDDVGAVAAWSCLDVRRGDDVRLFGSSAERAVYALVRGTGTLTKSALDVDSCDQSWQIGAPTDSFGPPVEWDRFVLVPDLTTGRASVVDAGSAATADLDLVAPGNRFELVAKDGLVFYNDLDSDTAGVLTFDGVRWQVGAPVSKYDPATGEPVAPVDPAPTGDVPTEPPAEPGDAAAVTTPADPTQQPPVDPPDVTSTSEVTPPAVISSAGGPGSGPRTTDRPSQISQPAQTTPTGASQISTTQPSVAESSVATTSEPTPTTADLVVTVSGTGTVHVVAPDGPRDCTDSCTTTVAIGAQLTLTAEAATTQTFQGWAGSCSGTEPTCVLTMATDATATAAFADRPTSELRLTFTDGAEGSVEVQHAGDVLPCDAPGCSYQIPKGDEVTLHASGSDGWVFTGWGGISGGCLFLDCTYISGQAADTDDGSAAGRANFVRVTADPEIDVQHSPAPGESPEGATSIRVEGGSPDMFQWSATSNDPRISVGFTDPQGNAAVLWAGVTDPNVPDGVISAAVSVDLTLDGETVAGLGPFTFDIRTNSPPVISSPACRAGDGFIKVITVRVSDGNPSTLRVYDDDDEIFRSDPGNLMTYLGDGVWQYWHTDVRMEIQSTFRAIDEVGNRTELAVSVPCVI